MPDSCSDRMGTDRTSRINPYAFRYLQLLCSTAACSPFLSLSPEQMDKGHDLAGMEVLR